MRSDCVQFGLLLKSARQRLGLYQYDLATRADVSQSLISRLERGEQDLVLLVNCLRLIRSLELPLEVVERALGIEPPAREAPDAVEPNSGRGGAPHKPLFSSPLMRNGQVNGQ